MVHRGVQTIRIVYSDIAIRGTNFLRGPLTSRYSLWIAICYINAKIALSKELQKSNKNNCVLLKIFFCSSVVCLELLTLMRFAVSRLFSVSKKD